MFRPFPLFISFFLLIGVAHAGDTQTVNPSGSNSDQTVINNALEAVYQSGGGTVNLNHGVYTIDGQIKIGSNTVLTGSPDAIVRVSSSSSQFFVDGVGIIGQIDSPQNDIEIHGFQIDGNCHNLPTSYANSDPGNYNAVRLIDLKGSTGRI